MTPGVPQRANASRAQAQTSHARIVSESLQPTM